MALRSTHFHIPQNNIYLFLAENLDKLPMCILKPDTVLVVGWVTRDSLRILTGFPPISNVDLPLGRRGSRVNLCKRLMMTPRLLLLFLVMYFMRAGRLLERCGGVPCPSQDTPARADTQAKDAPLTDRQTQRDIERLRHRQGGSRTIIQIQG